jgi:hypothetical protein
VHGDLIEQKRTPWPDGREVRISGIEFGTDRGKGAWFHLHMWAADGGSRGSEKVHIDLLHVTAGGHEQDSIYPPICLSNPFNAVPAMSKFGHSGPMTRTTDLG